MVIHQRALFFPSLSFGTEEFVTENKRLKGIGIGAPEGPISLDDFRTLQRSNTVCSFFSFFLFSYIVHSVLAVVLYWQLFVFFWHEG